MTKESGRNYSRELKLEGVSQIETGQCMIAQLCWEHQLARSLIHCWRKEVESRGESAFTNSATTDRGAELRIAEFIAQATQQFLATASTETLFIDPGSPWQIRRGLTVRLLRERQRAFLCSRWGRKLGSWQVRCGEEHLPKAALVQVSR